MNISEISKINGDRVSKVYNIKSTLFYLPSEVASCSEMFEIIGKPTVYFA